MKDRGMQGFHGRDSMAGAARPGFQGRDSTAGIPRQGFHGSALVSLAWYSALGHARGVQAWGAHAEVAHACP